MEQSTTQHIQALMGKLSNQPFGDSSKEPQLLGAYRDALFALHESKSDHYFSNSSETHAAIVYEVFFKIARNGVRIFCDNLKPSVFGELHVVTALEEAFSRGVHFDVLTALRPEDSAFLKLLSRFGQMKLANLYTFDRETPSEFNFCVVDDEAFRWEHDNQKTLAIGNMHQPDTAKKLSKYFDEVLLKDNELVVV